MRIIYIDKDYMCHISDGKGLRPVETEFFDGKVDEYIEGYRLIPDDEVWIRDDGMEFTGMICPANDFNALDSVQRQDEREALDTLGVIGEEIPSAMAETLKDNIDSVIDEVGLSKEIGTALSGVSDDKDLQLKLIRRSNELYLKRSQLDDNERAELAELHEEWKQGTSYGTNEYVRFGYKPNRRAQLYVTLRAIQNSQTDPTVVTNPASWKKVG